MPDARTTHPTPQELADFGLGTLPPDAQSSVHRHLESCPQCRRKVEEQPPDSFVGQLEATTPKGGTLLPTACHQPPPSGMAAAPAPVAGRRAAGAGAVCEVQ